MVKPTHSEICAGGSGGGARVRPDGRDERARAPRIIRTRRAWDPLRFTNDEIETKHKK